MDPGFAYLETMQELAETDAEKNDHTASRWDKLNLGVGIPAALLAGGGGVTALADVSGGWKILAAILAVSGGGLAGVATTLNASRRAEEARARATSLRAFAREASTVALLDRERFSGDDVRDVVEDLGAWLDEINGLPVRKSPYRKWLERRGGNPGGAPGLKP